MRTLEMKTVMLKSKVLEAEILAAAMLKVAAAEAVCHGQNGRSIPNLAAAECHNSHVGRSWGAILFLRAHPRCTIQTQHVWLGYSSRGHSPNVLATASVLDEAYVSEILNSNLKGHMG
ncbi:uncharacterized protein G2W53_010713 [Senna tora]|uniref:Uncharacterized protein n=1 Tax=Senna tora TaxID=362788 RepID=A0A834X0G4_9FABA|nr:uncharacterized protein G2W53_010713 [Senna tora]